MKFYFHTLLALIATIYFVACTPNKIYRENSGVICTYIKKDDCELESIQVKSILPVNEYDLGFIEFNDQGRLHSYSQKQNVINHIKKLAQNDNILLITFVHGWHHSAKLNDSNIMSFRKLLETASKNETKLSSKTRKKRKVVGLYIGWRGDTISLPVLKYLSFWDRKKRAHEIGQQGVAQTLLEIENIVKSKTLLNTNDRNKMVSIGHSFGAALLYSSLQGVLTERFLEGRPVGSTKIAKGFGDLVVLVNPAFEALKYGPLHDMSQYQCLSYPNEQRPKLVILTSEKDLGTRWAFPIGRSFRTMFVNHNKSEGLYCKNNNEVISTKIPEFYGDILAVGHYAPFMTHTLTKNKDNKSYLERNFTVNNKDNTDINWRDAVMDGQFTGTNLNSLNRSHLLNPYLNIQVSKEIIKGHNDIWQPEVKGFIADLLGIASR